MSTTSGFADVNGTHLWYELRGAGPPLVLVHSGITDSGMWDAQVRALGQQYRILRYDLRGFGRSPLPPGPFSNADDLLGLIRDVGLERPVVLGASMGGAVSLELAVAEPGLISALVLVGAGLPGHEWSSEITQGWEEEEALLDAGDADGATDLNVRIWAVGPHRRAADVDPAFLERVRAMQRLAFDVQLAAYAADPPPGPERRLEPALGGRLREITAQALVVVGELDVDDMHAIAERLVREIPDARKVQIAGTAHLPSMERPDEFNQALLDFLTPGLELVSE